MMTYSATSPKNTSRRCRMPQLFLSALVCLGAAFTLYHRHYRPSTSSVDLWDRVDSPNDPPRHLPLLVWTQWYRRTDFWEGRAIDYCGVGKPACIVTHDRRTLDNSPVILFHNADYNPYDQPPRQKSKPWVLFGRDAPIMQQPNALRPFDLTMTHRTDSDFPIPWFDRSLVDEALRPINVKRLNAKFSRFYDLPPLVWAENDCNPNSRYPAIVRQLNEHMPLHSYGTCVNTVPKGRDLRQAESGVRVIEPYKFVLITEYATCSQFIQSKIMDAFRAGIVPVVDGPQNYSSIAPSRNAIIHVSEFLHLEDLAEYLMKASTNQTLYLRHLDYRDRTLQKTVVSSAWRKFWGATMERGEWSGWCKLCEYATKRHFSSLRRKFKDKSGFVSTLRSRITESMTWHDSDLTGRPYVDAFLDSVPDPDPDLLRSTKSEFRIQHADQSCVAGKWTALEVGLLINQNHTEIRKKWARVLNSVTNGRDVHDALQAAIRNDPRY